MATGPRQDATGAPTRTGGRPSKAQARKQEIPQYGAYPTVRHLAGSRVPFSIEFVVSSTGQPRNEVGGVIKDAFDWGWINEAEGKTPEEVGGVIKDAFDWGWINEAEGKTPEGETLWIGRL